MGLRGHSFPGGHRICWLYRLAVADPRGDTRVSRIYGEHRGRLLRLFVKGAEWRYNIKRLTEKEWERRPPEPRASAPPGGFADDVDKLFTRYFIKYRPKTVKVRNWEAATAGIRRYVRNEIVAAYREQSVSAYEIAWLIRYRSRDVANRWQDGTLWDYRGQLQTPATTVLIFALGSALLVPGIIWAIDVAVQTDLGLAIVATIVLLASGYLSVTGWLGIVLEYRRFATDCEEEVERLADSRAEFERWKRLEPTPTDSEMATWLRLRPEMSHERDDEALQAGRERDHRTRLY